MDPMTDDRLDFGDEEFGGPQRMQYHVGGAIPALAEEEMNGEEDEYDDLYNDVNVGEGFMQFQAQKVDLSEQRQESTVSREITTTMQLPERKERMAVNLSQKGTFSDAKAVNLGFQGPVSVAQKTVAEPVRMTESITNEPGPPENSSMIGSRSVQNLPVNHIGTNTSVSVNQPMANENQIWPAPDTGATILYVGELHWWTTDAEIESVLSQYGRVKEIKFFDERASGKSKGYCQVEFYDSAAASACKEAMNGYVFNGRACVVAFASPQTIRQMGSSFSNKSQVQPPPQPPQLQGRRHVNDGVARGSGANFSTNDGGRNYGRGGWGRGGQGILNRGPGGNGPIRGRGGYLGPKNINGHGFGSGPGPAGGAFSGGFLHPQGIMGTGFDPTFMGRGPGYGGFPGPGFPAMIPQFPAVNTMGLAGVAPHVNPAFFGRGIPASGLGIMGTGGIDGHQSGLWSDSSLGGWGSEENVQRTTESSYGGDDGGSDYGYGEGNHDKAVRSTLASRETGRSSERDWSGNSEKRQRDEREEEERERYGRDYRYREDRDGHRDHHRQKERDTGYDDDYRSRSRDGDYGKRRRLPSD